MVFFGVWCAASIVAAHVLDRAALEHVVAIDLGRKDTWRMVRVVGYLPSWLVLGVVFLALDRGSVHRYLRCVMVFLGGATAGALAEMTKLLVGRFRPEMATAEQLYVFRGLGEFSWSMPGLGMASSHAAVAFGGCWMLGQLHPKGRVVFALIATACAVARVMEGAHYLSDVVAGAAIGVASAWAWWEVHLWMERRRLRREECVR